MRIIQNNPYRTVGLLVGATAKEQDRQIKRLRQFIEAEQETQDDYSFPTLGTLHRTLDKINDAASKLNLDSDKMNAALFWFYKGNAITDEPAFDAIKEGDLDQVLNIWTKLTTNGNISQRNASAYSNLGTLYLSGILEGTNTDDTILSQGISLKLKFLESDFFKDLKSLATDETFRTTNKELQLLFLRQIQLEIEKSVGITSNKFLDILATQEFAAKEEFMRSFVQMPIEQIEKKIEDIKKKAKENKSKAGDYGNDLYESTKAQLAQVKSLLGTTDIKVISISDKLANEILQCSIILFNFFHETETEVGEISLDLSNKAKLIALGSVIKERINESTPIVEKYIKDRPSREKQSFVRDDFEFITDKLAQLQTAEDSISTAINFANSCKPRLDNIKLKLGANDEFYSNICTTVVSNAQGMIVLTVNDAMEKRNDFVKYLNWQNNPLANLDISRYGSRNTPGGLNIESILQNAPYAPEYSLGNLKTVISDAWVATVTLGSFDMSNQQRNHYDKNKSTLLALYKQLNDGLIFFGDTPFPKWILYIVGIGLFILMLSTCN